MKRRDFLRTAGVGAVATAATGALAAPAIAQDVKRWKMVTAWPKNLPGPGVAAQMLADRITALSGGRGSVIRSVAGVLVLSLASNLLNLLEVSAFVQTFTKGLIVVAVILANQPRKAATA